MEAKTIFDREEAQAAETSQNVEMPSQEEIDTMLPDLDATLFSTAQSRGPQTFKSGLPCCHQRPLGEVSRRRSTVTLLPSGLMIS